MSYHRRVLITLFSLVSLLVATSASPPPPAGSCGKNGPFCQEGFCCSTSGFCGTTPAYCDPENCQSQCPSSPPPPVGSCGKNGPFCQEGFCCSTSGFCGTTPAYCDPENCQSQCPSSTPPSPPPPPIGPTLPGEDISSIIPSSLFEKMLMHRNDIACPAKGFYTYDAFITAAKSFPAFATTGDIETRKRELAAFFAQTSHETTGGWPEAPDGPYAWGYCFREEIGGSAGPDYCDSSNVQWPCVPGKKYYGRGPIQLSYNYNYGPCGEALGVDLLSNPDLVASDTVISFESALWFWMTPQPPKPSSHDVITQNWTPSPTDIAAGRLPGYGVITNIINGGLECGHGTDSRVEDRIGFYKRYCDLLGVSYGDNLDCYNQAPFGWGLLLDSM